MKATLNVHKNSPYANQNGRQFEVKETFTIRQNTIYALIGVNEEYPTNVVDFCEYELKNITNE